ncbi:hypothetical protein FPV67DRAFT_1563865 [Lyophyllum atratum]|nr:hypothetical protein FPV67DRAFT_1563865 [Lyophyllum atratum]
MTTDSRRIPIRVSNKKAYIWDVDDIATIRSKHHLCGVLTGTLPHLSQQNAFLGVPLVLMPEEVVLLVDNGDAVLIDDWNLEQQEDIKHQMVLLEAKGAKEGANSGRAMSAEAILKRQAREEKRAAKAKLVEAAGGPDSLGAMLAPEATVEGASRSQPPSSIDWYDPNPSCSYTTIAAAKAARIWDYPSNLQERAKCGVFRSLWEQGYFMGGGIKFGGDYLVYPGDPLRYHSHFAASMLDSPLSSLRPMEIVAHGRLGTATKKAHLLCCWDDEKKEVSYLTIEWAGFG